MKIISYKIIVLFLVFLISIISCSRFGRYDLPEKGEMIYARLEPKTIDTVKEKPFQEKINATEYKNKGEKMSVEYEITEEKIAPEEFDGDYYNVKKKKVMSIDEMLELDAEEPANDKSEARNTKQLEKLINMEDVLDMEDENFVEENSKAKEGDSAFIEGPTNLNENILVEKKTETSKDNGMFDPESDIIAIDQIDSEAIETEGNSNYKNGSIFDFKIGEKIVYDVKVLSMKNMFGFNKASVAFEVDQGTLDDESCYIFRGMAEGEGLGYKLRIMAESYLDRNSFRPILSTITQSGSENRLKKLVFQDDKIEYVKMKHCKSYDTCEVEEHFVVNDGTKIHCKKCKERKHYKWRLRATHNNEMPTYDLLSAVFVARTFDLEIGGKKQETILVDDRDLWKMVVSAIDEEIIETKIGSFNTLLLQLVAFPLNDHAKKQKHFRGLFGLKGDIMLWVEKDSKVPIRIRGSYPLLFDIPIEILIKSVEGNDINSG